MRDIFKNFNLERVLKFEWVCTLLKGTIFIQVMMLVSLGFIEGRCTFSIRMKEDCALYFVNQRPENI